MPEAKMRKNQLLCGVAAGSVMLGMFPLEVRAQQSLPTIEVGAHPQGARRGGGAPQGAVRSSGASTTGDASGNGAGSGPGSYWQQLAEKAKIPEGSYVAPYASTGTKTNTPIMNTPLNVQVVTPQQLKDRQVTNIQDAVKFVSGVTFTPNSSGWAGSTAPILIRGFRSFDYLRNGFLVNSPEGLGNLDMANIASVEVLKGSSAILYGMLEPGGIINVITKQPKDKAEYSLQQLFGSFAYYRTVASATGPVTADKSILYRVDIANTNSHSYVDQSKMRAFFVAPVVQWKFSPQTQLTAEFQYYVTKPFFFMNAIPQYNGYFLPASRGLNYTEDGTYNYKDLLGSIRWSHEFNNNWKLSHQIQYQSVRSGGIYQLPFFTGPVGDRIQVNRLLASYPYGDWFLSTQANLVGHFNTGIARHTLLAGSDYYRITRTWSSQFFFGSNIDFFFPIHPGTPFDLNTYLEANANDRQLYNFGSYVQDQIELPFGVHLMGGARYQNIASVERLEQNTALIGLPPAQGTHDQRVTPRVGALWRPQNWLSLYGNYAEGFGPNFGRIFPDKSAPNTDARQWEFGAKTEFFGGKLRATTAYFNITKTNVTINDIAHPGYVLLAGKVNSKGIEFDLQGEITPGWNATVAYAHIDTVTLKSDQKYNEGEPLPGVPRNQASIFTTYEFKHGDLKGLKFGGGAIYQDVSRYVNSSGQKLGLNNPAFATIDLMGAYEWQFAGMRMNAQLNVTNLLDTKYYLAGQITAPPGADTGGFCAGFLCSRQAAYGNPRNIVGSISASF